nr:odorant-binding protein 6 [Rhynchaenus maculosus]
MNNSVIFMICCCFCMISATKELLIKRIIAAREICQGNPDTAMEYESLRLFLEENGPKPNNLAAFAKCRMKNWGWLDSDGNINKAICKEHLEFYGFKKNQINVIIHACTNTEEDDETTTVNMLICMYKDPYPKLGRTLRRSEQSIVY